MGLEQQIAPDAAIIEGGDDQSQPRDFDAEARQHGWTPKEEFKGDPTKWVDAETFAKRADEVMPFLRKQNAGLKREIDDLKKQFRQASAHFSKAEERAYTRAMTDLQTRHDEAVETGDVKASRVVLKEMEELRADAPVAPKADAVEDDAPADAQQQIRAWIDDSAWYMTDDTKTRYADMQSDLIIKEHGALHKFPGGLPAALTEINGRVDRKFAEKKPSPTSGGGNRGGPQGGGKSFADLPAEAKAICDKWVKSGLMKSREDYVKSYDWS